MKTAYFLKYSGGLVFVYRRALVKNDFSSFVNILIIQRYQMLRCHLKLILVISFFFSIVSDKHVIVEVNRSAVVNGISQPVCQFVGACVTWQTQLKKACLCSRKTVGFLQENNTPLQVIPCIIILLHPLAVLRAEATSFVHFSTCYING